MKSLIGGSLALIASALLGAAMYQAVLNDPLPQPVADSVHESLMPLPEPTPTLTRTEVRTIIDPAPTITVEDVVEPPATKRTPTPAPRRTAAAKSSGGRTDIGEHESETAENAAQEAAEHAENEDEASRD